MNKLPLLFFLLPLTIWAHPGVGIVKDSKGNIFYTDLKQVWKISNGQRKVIVPDVHTHELYIDKDDNLFGEAGYYNDQEVKFYHYQWVYRSTGQLDTVIGMREQFIRQDFTLAKDLQGNEYYLKRFLGPHTDTNHIYRRSKNGRETVIATGNFKSVNWLHPQSDGTVLYVSGNAIYKIDTLGTVTLVKDQVANARPSFKFSENNPLVWGVWQDDGQNIYAAVFSDQSVKKIDQSGNITTVYTSQGNWAPLHVLFGNNNTLWVLESSDNNEVRVTMAEANAAENGGNKSNTRTRSIVALAAGAAAIVTLLVWRRRGLWRASLGKEK